MTDSHMYVYGVMHSAHEPVLDFKAVAEPGARPVSITVDGLQAIISPISSDEEVMPARRNLLGHARGLERMMEAGPVLPMRFGMVAPSVAAIEATLRANAQRLSAHLKALTGCAEYGVRVSWAREALMHEVVSREPALKKEYQALSGKPETQTHYQRVELGRQVEAAIAALREEEAARCVAAIEPLARESVMQEPEDELTILKLDLLMETNRVQDLAAVLEELENGRTEDYEIKLVGPAPAYNFSKIALDWADAASAA